ncbi:MAG TPA: N-acetylmuramoyl-L-alanine amidase [Thermoanaerobaculia bacterium]|nr:N-acetylmuramoyl-L-alanine amidase [Thermoanaerobaculia bacterium]
MSVHDTARLKRRLLRDLVQENLDLIEGRLPRNLKRRKGISPRVLLLGLLSVGLAGSTRLVPSPETPHGASLQFRPAAVGSGLGVTPSNVETPRGASPRGTSAPAPDGLAAPTPVNAAVFPLAVRRIALDPGHGGNSLGTRAPLGLIEKELTLDIAERLRKLLEAHNFQVLMTREGDRTVSLEDRGRAANHAGADIFVSIHLNWIDNPAARGVETYYLGPTDDPFLTRLAAEENRESGYSMADMRRLLDRIYADVRQGQSRRLAQVVQASLFRSIGKVNPGIEDRGIKAAPFIVLLATEMPAILAEVSCLSNEDEAELLTKPLYRQYIAEALAAGIRSYADGVEGEKGI